MCQMCDQSGESFCYLHKKYKARLTGPYFDNLFDYLWFKNTFMKRWKWMVRTKLKVFLSPKLERQIENNPELVLRIDEKIKQKLKEKDRFKKSWEYLPLVYSTSISLGLSLDLDIEELIQIGSILLSRLEFFVDSKKFDNKSISKYIKTIIKNFV